MAAIRLQVYGAIVMNKIWCIHVKSYYYILLLCCVTQKREKLMKGLCIKLGTEHIVHSIESTY